MEPAQEYHADNVKKTIESIIGADTKLKRRRKTEEDIKKEKFERIITALERVETRSVLLEEDFKLGLSTYDDMFYDIIDDILELYLGKEAFEIIEFYLRGRYNPDGTINQLLDSGQNVIPLESPSDLWDLIMFLRESIEKKSKKK
jgi:hypothetical protein